MQAVNPHSRDTTPPAQALAGLRVIDLCQRHASYCGKLLADMGADVVLVEPPGGSPLRSHPPLAADGTSMHFAYRNTHKHSITLDLRTPAGRDALRDLAAGAAVLLEDGQPGALAALGLDGPALLERNPALVITRITPFGQDGPYAGWGAEDITVLALGGFLYLGGDPGQPPLQAAGEQACAAGALFGAVATMLAVLEAESSGQGQEIDVSMQECVTLALETAAQFYDLEGSVRRRFGAAQKQAGYGMFRCADGHVFLMAGGIGASKFWHAAVAWFREEGMEGVEALEEPCWLERSYLETDAAKQRFAALFEGWARHRGKQELFEAAQARRIPCAPVNTPSELLRNVQLASRGFFQPLLTPTGELTLTVPGAPFLLSETPWRAAERAPRAGEHNQLYGLAEATA